MTRSNRSVRCRDRVKLEIWPLGHRAARYPVLMGETLWHSFHNQGSAVERTAHLRTISISQLSTIHQLVQAWLPHLDLDSSRVLEVGAYAHYGGHVLASRGADVVLFDVAPSSLEKGRALAHEEVGRAGAECVVGDFHDLPFPDGSFDLVYCSDTIHHSFTPEIVLREMSRVLGPGGGLILLHDNLQRNLCFYCFESNRIHQLTAFEQCLWDSGFLRTVAQPYPGSRPEFLFGMVENQDIPLSLYHDVIGEQADILMTQLLNLEEATSGFDRELLERRSGSSEALESYMRERLQESFDEARPLLGEKEQGMGFRLPTRVEVDELCREMAPRICKIPPEDDPDYPLGLADVLAPAVRLVARKRSAGDTVRATPAVVLPSKRNVLERIRDKGRRLVRSYRWSSSARPRSTGGWSAASGRLQKEGDIWFDRSFLEQIPMDLFDSGFPDLQSSDDVSIRKAFPAEDWRLARGETDSDGVVNRGPTGRIGLASDGSPGLLLMPIWVRQSERPYRIVFEAGAERWEFVVCSNDCALVALDVAESREVLMHLIELDGTPAELPEHVRIDLAKFFRRTMKP